MHAKLTSNMMLSGSPQPCHSCVQIAPSTDWKIHLCAMVEELRVALQRTTAASSRNYCLVRSGLRPPAAQAGARSHLPPPPPGDDGLSCGNEFKGPSKTKCWQSYYPPDLDGSSIAYPASQDSP